MELWVGKRDRTLQNLQPKSRAEMGGGVWVRRVEGLQGRNGHGPYCADYQRERGFGKVEEGKEGKSGDEKRSDLGW